MSKIKIKSFDDEEILEVDFYGGRIEATKDYNFIEVKVEDESSDTAMNLTYSQAIDLALHLQRMLEQKRQYDEQQQAKQWQEKIKQYEQLKQELSKYGYLK